MRVKYQFLLLRSDFFNFFKSNIPFPTFFNTVNENAFSIINMESLFNEKDAEFDVEI
jgi:hypothetical protein